MSLVFLQQMKRETGNLKILQDFVHLRWSYVKSQVTINIINGTRSSRWALASDFGLWCVCVLFLNFMIRLLLFYLCCSTFQVDFSRLFVSQFPFHSCSESPSSCFLRTKDSKPRIRINQLHVFSFSCLELEVDLKCYSRFVCKKQNILQLHFKSLI